MSNDEQTHILDSVIVFTDGSCSGNGKNCAKAGIGIYFPCGEFPNVSEAFTIAPITNQRAELYAIYQTLLTVTEKCKFKKLLIYSDSLYSIKCVTLWINNWKCNGWKGANGKPIKNLDIIKPICDILEKYNNQVFFVHVNSHTNNNTVEAIFNDKADKLACEGNAKNAPVIRVSKCISKIGNISL